jgi:hypothetical protein
MRQANQIGYTRHEHGNTQEYHQNYDDLIGRHNIFAIAQRQSVYQEFTLVAHLGWLSQG